MRPAISFHFPVAQIVLSGAGMKSMRRFGGWCPALMLSVICGSATTADAGPIYHVNRTIGLGGVTGTIETDGTLGPLADINLLGWTLTLDDGAGTFTLLGPSTGNNSSTAVLGSALTATSTGLFFDFSSSVDNVIFQNPLLGSGLNFWCLQGTDGFCSFDPGGEVVALIFTASQVATRAGVTQIASRTTAIAEPVTLLLLGVGVGAFVSGRERRTKN